MIEYIKKHSVKIFVFALNFLLAAIAVFVIREKDQERLLGKAQEEKNRLEGETSGQETLESFENSVNLENKEEMDGGAKNDTEKIEAPSPVPPAVPAEVVPLTPPTNPTPAVPAPAKKTKPADAKTKTS